MERNEGYSFASLAIAVLVLVGRYTKVFILFACLYRFVFASLNIYLFIFHFWDID